ncbi:hypothetical protein [Mycobacteroides immunogenum]|uniref:hypothetical protein n=1 Tax=Mycobacteroides immunogenum TaxID=83262 RepID=UPI000AD4864C|nr:hypothetical protein [Mycobacteroides immunogenum]
MSDPAEEAAKRTSEAYCRGQIPADPDSTTHSPGVDEIGEFAACEALRPICKWYGKAMATAIAEDLYEQQDLLESLAPLIFSTEELNQ